MITKDLKISTLLKNYPGSLDLLLRVSPHFQKLQNKYLRKALAGRVTLEQAASIAGVDVNILLSALNNLELSENGDDTLVSGIIEEASESELVKPSYLQSLDSSAVITLDVRPILDSGKDPLNLILNEIKRVNRGNALMIINSFEPIPLYDLLGKKGFSHWTEFKDDYWNVYFYNEKDEVHEVELPTINEVKIDLNDYENVIELDVHDLPAPEPMIKILENLNRIDENSVMLVNHHREPLLLYPKLEERGYEAMCKRIEDERYQVFIVKKRLS